MPRFAPVTRMTGDDILKVTEGAESRVVEVIVKILMKGPWRRKCLINYISLKIYIMLIFLIAEESQNGDHGLRSPFDDGVRIRRAGIAKSTFIGTLEQCYDLCG